LDLLLFLIDLLPHGSKLMQDAYQISRNAQWAAAAPT